MSKETVRNWIKSGYFEYYKKIGISRHSFKYFCENVVGIEKLNKRAKKSQTDHHNRDDLVSRIESALNTNQDVSQIAVEYQNGLSNAYKNKEGIYYTPETICRRMFSDIPKPMGEKHICDPCCGGGNFIAAAIRHGFHPENVHGYDTDPTALEITKQRILKETGYRSDKIICGDFLSVVTSYNVHTFNFDAILTNPPWGKKLQKQEKLALNKKLGAGRSLDTSSLFFLAALKSLREDGYLALLIPETFFKIASFEDVRRQLLKYSLVSVRDFEKPFMGLLTKAQSFCIQKTSKTSKQLQCTGNDKSFKRSQRSFIENPASIINFPSSSSDMAVISQLFNKDHITLEGKAKWGLGIVTGNNKRFVKENLGEGLIPVYKGIDIH